MKRNWVEASRVGMSGDSNPNHFRSIAEHIANLLKEKAENKDGLKVPDLIPRGFNFPINVYPSSSEGACQKDLVVISLTKPRAKGPGHLSFPDSLTKLLDHVGHICKGTKRAALITDTWDARVVDARIPALKALAHGIELEIYLVGSGWVSEIPSNL